MFQGSYIQVILDIATTDPRCNLSFVKSDLENARKELAELQAAQHTLAGGQAGSCPNCSYHNTEIRCRSCGHTYTPAAKA